MFDYYLIMLSSYRFDLLLWMNDFKQQMVKELKKTVYDQCLIYNDIIFKSVLAMEAILHPSVFVLLLCTSLQSSCHAKVPTNCLRHSQYMCHVQCQLIQHFSVTQKDGYMKRQERA